MNTLEVTIKSVVQHAARRMVNGANYALEELRLTTGPDDASYLNLTELYNHATKALEDLRVAAVRKSEGSVGRSCEDCINSSTPCDEAPDPDSGICRFFALKEAAHD